MNSLQLNYEKRKNTILFDKCKNTDIFHFDEIQNYIPIYKNFFELNDTNFNNINLNHSKYIYDINSSDDNLEFIIKQNEEVVKQNVFIKFAPILDPFKYMIGKYNKITDFTLPNINQVEKKTTIDDKINDCNNSAYVDGLFSFLSSKLLNEYNFVHGIDFFGSFVGIKNNFKLNIADDLEYLIKYEFFNKNKNLFSINDEIIEPFQSLPPIIINHSKKANISISSIHDEMFEDVFTSTEKSSVELEDFEVDFENSKAISLKSNSSCSSRTSYSEQDDEDEDDEEDQDDEEQNDEEQNDGEEEDDDETIDTPIYATIPKFPVNMICMEKCIDTFDSLILQKQLQTMDEWFTTLMQIIMILITYQKCFSFTHNDLHTNNIMFVHTEKKHLYYCYNKKHYKVPTYGRIFKIIDFGRSIYKVNNKILFSDSFKKGEDAATQYNCEPFFNDSKPRIEPNFSFDLCRLACSIFDYVVDDMEDLEDLNDCSPIIRLIVEWCKDDNGLNVLYKKNGDERYEDFKLYKMIARSVHKHTPQEQLKRPEFNKYFIEGKKIPKTEKTNIMNIDSLNIF
jgi:hypothetical protein